MPNPYPRASNDSVAQGSARAPRLTQIGLRLGVASGLVCVTNLALLVWLVTTDGSNGTLYAAAGSYVVQAVFGLSSGVAFGLRARYDRESSGDTTAAIALSVIFS